MVAVPLYGDLGKLARDCFTKGYHANYMKLDTTTYPHSQAEFKINSAHNIQSQKLFANIELKYKFPQYGVTLTEKWNTDGIIATELQGINQLNTKNTKCTLASDYSPQTKKANGKLKFQFEQPNFNITTELSNLFNMKEKNFLNTAAVFQYEKFQLGINTQYNMNEMKFAQNEMQFGYNYGNFIVNAIVTQQQQYRASIYHRINSQLQLAVQSEWSQEKPMHFGLATIAQIDPQWNLRAKFANNKSIALSTEHQINSQIKFIATIAFNHDQNNAFMPLYGCGIEFNAK